MQFRLETLLWGGDELIWVVPVWKGWQALAFFCERAAGWAIADAFPRASGAGARPLTHAGGLVFCHHNAPIHRMTHLAKDLAKEGDFRRENRFVFEVLESFDHVGRDLKEYRKARCPGLPERLILAGKDMADVARLAAVLKGDAAEFPRRQHRRLVRGYLRGAREVDLAAVDGEAEALVRSLPAPAREAWLGLEPLLGGARVAWVQLWQLWDYLP